MIEKERLFQIATEVKDKLHPKVDAIAVKLNSISSNQVRFTKNNISIAKNWDDTTLSVLVDKDERVTALDVGISGQEKIDEILSQLMAYMEKAPKKQDYAPFPDPADTYPAVDNFDATLKKKPEKLVEYAKVVIEEGKHADIDYVAGAIKSEVTNEVLVTSTGAELHEKESNVYLDVRASAGEMEKGHSSMASAFIGDIDPKQTAIKAVEYAERSKNPKSIDSGKYTTLFIPDAAAGLLTWLGMMSSAFFVQMGYSFLQEPGQKVGSEHVSIIDDPHHPRGFRSRRFDDEGQPTQQIPIIEHGEVRGYLHNRFTAKSFQQEPTGNAGWITPHAWQLKFEAGSQSEGDMIASIDEGLVVGNVTYLRFQNPMKGTFSAVVRDGVYFVEDGEIQHAVKNLRLADSFPDLLSNVRSIERDQRQIMHWWLHVPVITGSFLADDVKYTRPVK
ncbi:MAG: TldD/PmbA family protein [Candidatus Korarchaeota archaeon]|nr:TldD/PmbA family protein [Candidatus Korarchaeota archaeon]NIU84725.1 hypothetical protein [Candidatus Thorarchaeota archaeon]NIW14727.1 hypothetical protein [Candidatus Thorarchaeota archaeon]NIW52801.1 hypothetical protein [Candidatus Korarchaeota archaeon]